MRARPPRGFTLVEMSVVLLIIALGTVLVVPMIEGGFDSREVRRAARQIAATMHHVHGEAVALGEPQELVISPDENAIATTDWGRWVVLTDRAIIEKIVGGTALGDGRVQILFYPNGSSSGAEITIASRGDRSRNRLRVSLDPLVGTIRVGDATS